MIRILPTKRYSPIGVDIGSRCVKLVQLSADHSRLTDASRWDLPWDNEREPSVERKAADLSDAIRQARHGHNFRGTAAVLCLSDQQMFLQNIRVPKAEPSEMDALVQQEVAGRLPFPVAEAEIRYVEAADIRHGETVLREVIAMACHRPVLDAHLSIIEAAGLRPVAVDVEPLALHRSLIKQLRRDEDRDQRTMFVQIGYSRTVVLIAQGDDVLFIKYIPTGGKNMDEAVARHLDMKLSDAISLRKHNGDRRSDQQDPDVARSISEALRPVISRIVNELSMCVRYHSVTFRGKPLFRLLLGGGEATPQILEDINAQLNLKGDVSDPLRGYAGGLENRRRGQWDVATGLALRQPN